MRRLQPGDSELTWVVTLTFAGEIWRWTSWAAPSEFSSWTGRYAGTVAIDDIVEAISLRGELPRQAVSVAVVFPRDAPVAAAIAAGYRLDGAPVEVALVPMSSGDLEADRYVVFSGFVADPDYGDADEPVAFEVRRYEFSDRASYPPATWRVSALTWPTTDVSPTVPPGISVPDLTRTYSPSDAALDAPYPVPFGVSGASGNIPTSDALVVEESNDSPPKATTVLVAGGHVADTCLLWYESSDGVWTSQSFSVVRTTDAIGQPVSTIDVSGAADALREARPLKTSFPNGGIALPGGGVLRGAARIGTWWLRQSSIPAGLVAAGGAGSVLDAYELAGAVTEPVAPIEWLADRLIGVLPCALLTNADGAYELAAIRWQAGARDAVAHLQAGDSTVERVDPVQIRGDGRTRTVKVEYARHAGTKAYTRVAYRVAVDRPDTDVVETAVQLPDVDEERTASLFAEWLVWRDARPHPEIRLQVATSTWCWLAPGDVVLYTESGLYIDAQPHLVLEVTRTASATSRVVLTPTAGGQR